MGTPGFPHLMLAIIIAGISEKVAPPIKLVLIAVASFVAIVGLRQMLRQR